MNKSVSKSVIIKALLEEPLEAGNWIHGRMVLSNESLDWKRVIDEQCEVCAVGAILRRAGCSPIDTTDEARRLLSGDNPQPVNNYVVEAAQKLKQHRYITALSVYFEGLCKHGVNDRKRKLLARWVEKNFPNRIRLT